MKVVLTSFSKADEAAVAKHVEWMRGETTPPISLTAVLPDVGHVTITVNGSVFKIQDAPSYISSNRL